MIPALAEMHNDFMVETCFSRLRPRFRGRTLLLPQRQFWSDHLI